MQYILNKKNTLSIIFLILIYFLQIIYVNSTTSETIKVEKTVPAFKAWSSRLLYKRQKEELKLGFGCLPIAEGVEVIEPKIEKAPKKKKLIKKQKKSETGILNKNLFNFVKVVYF